MVSLTFSAAELLRFHVFNFDVMRGKASGGRGSQLATLHRCNAARLPFQSGLASLCYLARATSGTLSDKLLRRRAVRFGEALVERAGVALCIIEK